MLKKTTKLLLVFLTNKKSRINRDSLGVPSIVWNSGLPTYFKDSILKSIVKILSVDNYLPI
jgi:hypothetical protein